MDATVPLTATDATVVGGGDAAVGDAVSVPDPHAETRIVAATKSGQNLFTVVLPHIADEDFSAEPTNFTLENSAGTAESRDLGHRRAGSTSGRRRSGPILWHDADARSDRGAV